MLAPSFTYFPQSADVVAQVVTDVHAIGCAAAMRVTPAVKIIALVPRAGAAPVGPTAEDIVADRYPLDRHLMLYTRLPLEPWLREFLHFAFSPAGQRIVAGGTLGYLPLSPAAAKAEWVKLDAVP